MSQYFDMTPDDAIAFANRLIADAMRVKDVAAREQNYDAHVYIGSSAGFRVRVGYPEVQTLQKVSSDA